MCVRRAATQRRSRNDLVWYFAGLVMVQLGLAAGIDGLWPALRDPTFGDVRRIVHDRQADAPGRPLVLALGSSRTKMALRAERLNHPEDASAPIVINAAQLGGGPMQHLALLGRLLRDGVHPDLIFLEVMPMALSNRDGRPMEERVIDLSRFSAAEVARMLPYCAQPLRFAWPWALVHIWPCQHYRDRMRDVLSIDTADCARCRYLTGDGWGWQSADKAESRQDAEARTRSTLETHRLALTQPALAPGAMHAFRDVIGLCRREGIPVVLFMPAECSGFRNYCPEVAKTQAQAVRQLAAEAGVSLIDARTWIDDDGFMDGHHARPGGADQFTARFAREALAPYRHLADGHTLPDRVARNDLD
jgi:hypothetical protein